MKRIIVDYSKLTNEILNLLVEKFPDGYDDSDVISFKNAKGEIVEAVEVRTEDTIYLVKVSTKLASRIENYEIDDEDDIDDVIIPDVPLDKIKGAGVDLDDDDDDEEDEKEDKPEVDEEDEDEDGENKSSRKSKDDDDDDDDE
jgi:DNA-directed RNA polymerase subunit delta